MDSKCSIIKGTARYINSRKTMDYLGSEVVKFVVITSEVIC